LLMRLCSLGKKKDSGLRYRLDLACFRIALEDFVCCYTALFVLWRSGCFFFVAWLKIGCMTILIGDLATFLGKLWEKKKKKNFAQPPRCWTSEVWSLANAPHLEMILDVSTLECGTAAERMLERPPIAAASEH